MKNQARKLESGASARNMDAPRSKGVRDAVVIDFNDSYSETINSFQVRADWLCLFTQPHREKLAYAALSELGFEVYLPFQRKLVFRRGKRVPIKAPLFSRYIFIKADKDDADLFIAHRQLGVTGFAGTSFVQSFISGEIIDEIRGRECPEGFVGLNQNT